jgi:hypothetical protein
MGKKGSAMVSRRPRASDALILVLFTGCALDLAGDLGPGSDLIPDATMDLDGVADFAVDPGLDPTVDRSPADLTVEEASGLDASDPPMETIDPVGPDADEPETGPYCGDGRVDAGEECDDGSSLCIDCMLIPPTGWRRCNGSSGDVSFYFIEDWPGIHTWAAMRDRCRDLAEALNPLEFSFYGLAVFTDAAVWDCVDDVLLPDGQYYIGLVQRPDGLEPDGGWVWIGYDGADWVELAPWVPGDSFFPSYIDGTCGEGEVDCGRFMIDLGEWSFWDYGCDSQEEWDGICMIQF